MVKLPILIIMLLGLAATLVPKVPGTLIIFGAALLYIFLPGNENVPLWLIGLLSVIVIIAEIGGRWLRISLTKCYHLTRLFSSNASVGNIASVVAADALLGPVLGILLWELVAGKTFSPRLNTVAKVIVRLVIAAMFRFLCGLVMIILVLLYLF